MRNFLYAVLAGCLHSMAPPADAQVALPYPYTGDLSYDGNQYADSFFGWAVPGRWSYRNSGWELDVVTDSKYFESCTSWTNLPEPYDDCPTAGVVEDDPSRRAFGVGSFNKDLIQGESAGVLYKAQWWFGGGYSASTSPDVTWQEVATIICSDRYNIWCYESVQSGRLMTTYWRYLEPSFDQWDYYANVYP